MRITFVVNNHIVVVHLQCLTPVPMQAVLEVELVKAARSEVLTASQAQHNSDLEREIFKLRSEVERVQAEVSMKPLAASLPAAHNSELELEMVKAHNSDLELETVQLRSEIIRMQAEVISKKPLSDASENLAMSEKVEWVSSSVTSLASMVC